MMKDTRAKAATVRYSLKKVFLAADKVVRSGCSCIVDCCCLDELFFY